MGIGGKAVVGTPDGKSVGKPVGMPVGKPVGNGPPVPVCLIFTRGAFSPAGAANVGKPVGKPLGRPVGNPVGIVNEPPVPGGNPVGKEKGGENEGNELGNCRRSLRAPVEPSGIAVVPEGLLLAFAMLEVLPLEGLPSHEKTDGPGMV